MSGPSSDKLVAVLSNDRYIMTLEKYFPELKRIFIDEKDADLF